MGADLPKMREGDSGNRQVTTKFGKVLSENDPGRMAVAKQQSDLTSIESELPL